MSEAKKSRFGSGMIWALVLVIGGVLVFLFHFDTYHFAVVQDGVLYRMGMRNTRELNNVINRVHPKTVVCLVTDTEVNEQAHGDFQGEFDILKKDGIALERIPMVEDHAPTQAQIDEFLHIVTDKKNQPVIVHCAQGVVRTGMMVAAFEKDVLGYSKQQALDAVQIFGKGIERSDEVRRFINQYYDQQSAQVAATQ